MEFTPVDMFHWPPLSRERGFTFMGQLIDPDEPQPNVPQASDPKVRVYCFVDGFNLYHALNWYENEDYPHADHTHCGIDHVRYRKYKWLSLTNLARCFVGPKKEMLVGVEYFTTYAHWDEGKVFRHKCFVMAQVNEGVKVTFGKFKAKNVECKATCKARFTTWTEKQTDVNIAVRLVELARQDAYDKALLISGDSDLVPAIKLVRQIYSEKDVAAIVPIGRRGDEINQAATSKFKMTEDHLRRSAMANVVALKTGISVKRPEEWV